MPRVDRPAAGVSRVIFLRGQGVRTTADNIFFRGVKAGSRGMIHGLADDMSDAHMIRNLPADDPLRQPRYHVLFPGSLFIPPAPGVRDIIVGSPWLEVVELTAEERALLESSVTKKPGDVE